MFANQSWQETRHWNTWHFSSSLLRKHYIFWKVNVSLRCCVLVINTVWEAGWEVVWLWWAPLKGCLYFCWQLLHRKVRRHRLANLLERDSFNKGSFPGHLMWYLSLFVGHDWIKTSVFLCVLRTQENWILSDTHRSQWQNIGDPVAFALPWIRCFLFCWRMPSV